MSKGFVTYDNAYQMLALKCEGEARSAQALTC